MVLLYEDDVGGLLAEPFPRLIMACGYIDRYNINIFLFAFNLENLI